MQTWTMQTRDTVVFFTCWVASDDMFNDLPKILKKKKKKVQNDSKGHDMNIWIKIYHNFINNH